MAVTSGRQPNFAALNRQRHLCLAGRPSHWALAHNLVIIMVALCTPLDWWRASHCRYPTVAKVARRLLAVPATSIASERLLSKAGNVITKKRNCLAPSKADAIVFLMENLL